ncbi:MAG: helix-turn-helix transcriptional regulator [Lentisphaerae bacterium]|jgi:DNA-binding transcriptional regulator YiaG|nr:helix-turn-helix transcriptional regulator [Lentisphaerota bacterium]
MKKSLKSRKTFLLEAGQSDSKKLNGKKEQEVSDEERTAHLRTIIGRNIRAWREYKNLPLKCLASEVKVSISICSQWENGLRFPCPNNLVKLAHIFGCSPSCIMCHEFDMLLKPEEPNLTNSEKF